MEIVKLNDWDEFEKLAKQEINSDIYYASPRHTIFRGQSNAEWSLKTSVERVIGENMDAENYFRLIKKIENKIETFTNQRWNLPSYEEFEKEIREKFEIDEQTFFYLTYLRHFGFPTPLLDWTGSPFIAAYFAFRDLSSTAEEIAIYMLSLSSAHGFGVHVDDHSPYISPIIKSPRNNKRHELQQGVYTICLKEDNKRIHFANHEDGGLNSERTYPFAKKIILPASERVNALQALQIYNITPFSLFGTEESLLETLLLELYKFAGLNQKGHEEYLRRQGEKVIEEFKRIPTDNW